MQVAKYWRNNKLRYRLIRLAGQDRREHVVLRKSPKDETASPQPIRTKQVQLVT